jgi:thioredoxin-dependent peroxiredoxin
MSADYEKLGIQVLGVSADSVARHAKFRDKYGLPFPLLSDTERTVLEAYGAWREKQFMGRTYMGIARISFLIGPDGKVFKAYEAVKPPTHAGEVLADTRAAAG